MRKAFPGLIGIACLAAAVAPALAADQTVTVSGNSNAFSPQTVTIDPGDTVTWEYPTGSTPHNVQFSDWKMPDPATGSGSDWPVSRTFPANGTFQYRCEVHGAMRGTVQVGPVDPPPTSTATATATVTADPSSTPGASPTPGGTATPGPTATPAPAASASVRRARRSFCVRRSARCRRPGVVLLVDATGPLTLHGVLARVVDGRARRFGTLRFRVDEATRRVAFRRTRAGRRLSPGRYELRMEGDRIAFRVVG